MTAAAELGNLLRALDALSLDVARDVGAVIRGVRAARATVTDAYRAGPRAAQLGRAVARLATRHRWLRLVAAADGRDGLSEADHRDLARRATAELAALRGGAAKLGQLASCRPDIVGAVWAAELATLQDDVPPLPADAIRARIEAELGRTIDQAYSSFDDTPLAAASLAQVHAATLADGTAVVVKVQVPGIEHAIAADIATLRALAAAKLPGVESPGFASQPPGAPPQTRSAARWRRGGGIDLATLADELGDALRTELDYVAEADALDAFAATTTACVVPRPIRAASTARVLTMTRIAGTPLTEALDAIGPSPRRDRLVAALVGELAAQVFARGLVHADPHPGNVLVTPDDRLALLDFGCVLRLTRADRLGYARLVGALATGDAATAAAQLDELGFRVADPAQLVELARSMLAALRPGTTAATLDWQAAIADQLAKARALGTLVVPRSFVLVGRALATVAGVVARYKPDVQLYAVIAPHLAAAVAAS